MTRILIVGNSGSGKTTLARRLHRSLGLAHLDLDSLAWLDCTPPQRRPLTESAQLIQDFTRSHENWVIEGCYADLLALLQTDARELVFLQIPIEQCVDHARRRPFEPEKYATEEAQNANLAMLIEWIKTYPDRDDACSLAAHRQLVEAFPGHFTALTSAAAAADWLPAADLE